MALDFPASPSTGTTYTGPNGVVWIWDGVKWTVGTQSGAYLPLSGGTLTGVLNMGPTGGEGGQIDFLGSGSDPTFSIDNVGNTARLFWVTPANTTFQIINAGTGTADVSVEGGVFAGIKIGIGTQTPRTNLEISTASFPSLAMTETTAGVNLKTFDFAVNGGQFIGRCVTDDYGAANEWLRVIRTGATTSSVAFPNGYVGIGAVPPIAKLHVFGAGQATANVTTTNLNNAIFLTDSGGAVGNGGMIVFGAAGDNWRFASIKGFVTDGSGNSRGEIVFSTRLVATDSTLAEAMRITSNGALYGGQQSPPTSGGPSPMQRGMVFGASLSSQQLLGFGCYHNGSSTFVSDIITPSYCSFMNADPGFGTFSLNIATAQTNRGDVVTTAVGRLVVGRDGVCYNATGTWAVISDVSTKNPDTVKPYERGLDAILALQPVTFAYGDKYPFGDDGGATRFGLMADQVKPHIPEIVGSYTHTSEMNGVKGAPVEFDTLDPGRLIYALINAVKELKAEIDALKGTRK